MPTYYRRKELQQALKRVNIRYENLEVLGNPPSNRDLSNPTKAKETYLDHILLHRARLVRILNYVDSPLVFCLICYCATHDTAKCHRFWLKEFLEEKANEN